MLEAQKAEQEAEAARQRQQARLDELHDEHSAQRATIRQAQERCRALELQILRLQDEMSEAPSSGAPDGDVELVDL